MFVLGRTEFEWYIKVDKDNRLKYYKLGKAKNVYYCIKKKCILMRRPFLSEKIEVSAEDNVPDEVSHNILDEFSVNVMPRH